MQKETQNAIQDIKDAIKRNADPDYIIEKCRNWHRMTGRAIFLQLLQEI